VLVGVVLVEWLRLVDGLCEVVVLIFEGLFWFLIRLVFYFVRLSWVQTIVICSPDTSNRARSLDVMHSKVTRLEAWPFEGAARMLRSSSHDHMV
jgi:hypothetical protein